MSCCATKWNNLKNLINLLLASSPGKSSQHSYPPFVTNSHKNTCTRVRKQTDAVADKSPLLSPPSTTNLHSRADVLLALLAPTSWISWQPSREVWRERGRRGRKGWIRFWFAIRRLDFERRQRGGLWLCGMPFFFCLFSDDSSGLFTPGSILCGNWEGATRGG